MVTLMTLRDWIQLFFLLGSLIFFGPLLGKYLEKVFCGEKTILFAFFNPLEQWIYRFLKINPKEEQTWTTYSLHLCIFSFVSFCCTLFFLIFQNFLPFNPQHFKGLDFDLAFNIAISFMTNTNWQSYAGEETLSYFSQMVALVSQNFFSAAVGLSASFVCIRGFSRHHPEGLIGHFWIDLIRAHLYVLLPLCFIYAIFLVSQGVIQNFLPYTEITTLEGQRQLLPQGPVASQVAIKILGSNGGGFFNANSAHPFENPTPLTNWSQLFLMFLIPNALLFTLGRKVKNISHSWTLWFSLMFLFLIGLWICVHFEYTGTALYEKLGCTSPANWEGKETRFGIFNSALFGSITTSTSCGAMNAVHESFTAMGGFVLLVNLLLGSIIFGGIGSGLYGIFMYILLTVFIAGLMVGRTPEYLGKKIESNEIKFMMIAFIAAALSILGGTVLGVLDPRGLMAMSSKGPHGFSEILYAYASTTANNGSAFSGLATNTPFWYWTLSISMLVGRFLMMIPMLAVAGSLVKKKIHWGGVGTFPVTGPTFVCLFLGVMIIVGALTYFPVLALGPIEEYFELLRTQRH